MTYTYRCSHCNNTFDRSGVSYELRDDLQVCEYCAQGATRVFTPTLNLVVPERFGYLMADVLPTYADHAAIERSNEEYARTKEPERKSPTFEQMVQTECQKAGL